MCHPVLRLTVALFPRDHVRERRRSIILSEETSALDEPGPLMSDNIDHERMNTEMFGKLNAKRMITGVLAGMALFSTFLAAPPKAHASYSLNVPSAQQM